RPPRRHRNQPIEVPCGTSGEYLARRRQSGPTRRRSWLCLSSSFHAQVFLRGNQEQGPCQTHGCDPRLTSPEGYVDVAGRSDASEVPVCRAYCKGRWATCTTGKRAVLQFISGREIQTFNFGRGCGFEPVRPGGPARAVGI